MSNAWQRDSHAGNAGIAIIFYKKRPIFCRNTQIDLVPDKEHIFKAKNNYFWWLGSKFAKYRPKKIFSHLS